MTKIPLYCPTCGCPTLEFSDFWDLQHWTHRAKCRTCDTIFEQPFTPIEEAEASRRPHLVTARWFIRRGQHPRQAPTG